MLWTIPLEMTVVSDTVGLLEFYNKYHGPQGRFASGTGSPGEIDRPVGNTTHPVDIRTVKPAFAPDMGNGHADPGEIIWTFVPYADKPGIGKDRPGVVLGTVGEDLAVVPLTSKSHSGQVPVRGSEAKVDVILRVKSKDIRKEKEALTRPEFDALLLKVAQRHFK